MFQLFLKKPRTRKERKNITNRIITKSDIETILATVQRTKEECVIVEDHARQFTAFVLFGAYTGQRPYSTISQLRVEQFREALQREKATLHVEATQDKIRMSHCVPLHLQPTSVMSHKSASKSHKALPLI